MDSQIPQPTKTRPSIIIIAVVMAEIVFAKPIVPRTAKAAELAALKVDEVGVKEMR